jgi:phage terminase large subunit
MTLIEMPDKLRPLIEKRKRFKVAYGGRGAAKSMTYGTFFSLLAGQGNLVGCFREYQNSISESVYSLIKNQIEKYGMPDFNIGRVEINHVSGGGFRFKGLARSIESVKSMYGFKYFWLEEGQFISEESLKILTPTLREEDSELWVSANPISSADPFSQRFLVPHLSELEKSGYFEDDLHLIIKINYSDNPWFPPGLEQERKYDYETLSRAMYDHIWEGAFNDSVEDSIIKTEWFDAAIDSHKKLNIKPSGAIVVSHDPSDLGTDDKGLVTRHGILIKEAESRDFGDINEGCDWALDRAIAQKADLFVWDTDGMGIGLKRQVAQALKEKKIGWEMFSGAGEPDRPQAIYEPVDDQTQKQKTNADTFRNKRAQYYWMLRDRFFRTYLAVEKKQYIDPEKLISIDENIKDLRLLRSETCRIPRRYNSLGKIQIMSKPEMLKLKIQSPNLADSLMMSMVSPAPVSKIRKADPKPVRSYFN